jgi:hypothetical protein
VIEDIVIHRPSRESPEFYIECYLAARPYPTHEYTASLCDVEHALHKLLAGKLTPIRPMGWEIKVVIVKIESEVAFQRARGSGGRDSDGAVG